MFAYHPALAERSRLISLPHSPGSVRPWEIGVLAGCGLFAAAAVVLLDFSLKVPGHAILRSVIPMSFGLAVVPRRGAGLMMSGAALLGLTLAGSGGYSPGSGAMTSLLATGPLLDIASRLAGRGWRLAGAFGAAALASNLLAFAVRAATQRPTGGGGVGAGRGAGGGWWSIAPVSYAVCGLVAGLLCAVIWFRWSAGTDSPSPGPRVTE